MAIFITHTDLSVSFAFFRCALCIRVMVQLMRLGSKCQNTSRFQEEKQPSRSSLDSIVMILLTKYLAKPITEANHCLGYTPTGCKARITYNFEGLPGCVETGSELYSSILEYRVLHDVKLCP